MDYLVHHGIIGQHWGVRRFQNKDGTWTNSGLERRRSQYKYNTPDNVKNVVSYNDNVPRSVIDKDYNTANIALKDGVIKKGTPLYRASNNRNESLDDKRKYVSITETG